jgi:hypothetical protein
VDFYERYLKGNTAFDAVLTGAQPLPGVTADIPVRPAVPGRP